MSRAPEQQRLSPAERANLVAYLDGELNEAESRAINTKLTQSVTARRELEALEKTWELLDYLPRPQVSPEFTTRTLTQVRQLTDRGDLILGAADQAARRVVRVLTALASALVTVALAYAITRWVVPDPSARLVRDLSLAEHLDEYLDVGSYAFLRQLDDSPEFAEDTSLLVDVTPKSKRSREHRLRSMSREERLVLLQNLEKFDRLSPAEQAAVRQIDTEVAKLDPPDRARLDSLLRRYHLWLQGLPALQLAELKAVGEPQRIELVRKFREAGRAQRQARGNLQRAQLAGTGQVSLFETARLLRVWSDLPREEREQVDRLKKDDERRKRLLDLAGKRGFATNPGPTPQEWATIAQHLNVNGRLRKTFEAAKTKQKAQQFRHWAEAMYFMDQEPDVSPANLARFEASLPNWFLAHLDALPPDGARRRLAALYRLIYPRPEEIGPAEPAEKSGSAAAGQPRPRPAPPPPPGQSSPF